MFPAMKLGRAISLSIATVAALPQSIYADQPVYLSLNDYYAYSEGEGDEVTTRAVESTEVGSPQQGYVAPQVVPENFAYAPVAQPAVVAAEKPAKPKKKEDLQAAMKDAYKGVFYANNFSYLDDPSYDGPMFFGDSLKGMANGKLDIGGEYRTRFHHENNHRGLGLTGLDDEFWLTRLRLFTNYRITKNIRFYGEYLYADSAGESLAPRPIEENRGEAQNLFVDFKLIDNGSSKVTARVGRQELLLGAQRLVSPLDWANTRRTFDGYRMTYGSSDIDLDLFYTNPVARVAATGGTNRWDSADDNQQFYGAYATRKGLEIGSIDAYYLGYDNQTANFSYHTIGSRLAGSGDFFLYELEGGVQFGSNGNGTGHGAGFMTAGLGHKMTVGSGAKKWTPTLWAWYDYASGGDATFVAPGDDGFHHYFPLAHKYNGFMDLFGRRNLNDVNLQFISPIGSRVNFLLWYHYFFLDQATTPYSVVMTPFNAANTAGSKDLGHEIDTLFTINLNPRNSLLIGYSFFNSGDYYRTTTGVPTSADADFFYCQYQSQF
ncbi:MAG: alginate export family protein [Planctomycetales bacterium]|nr:alginate export family protein [Planctomycetales bacterium]